MTAPPAGPPQVVIAGHICLDVFPALSGPPDLGPGRLTMAGPAALSTGGAVANVGVALHRLGVAVRLMGKVGDDRFGAIVLDVLRGVDPRLAEGMIVRPGETTSYSIVISPPALDRSFLHCPGANATFGPSDVPLERLAGARIFHLGYPPIMPRLYSNGGAGLRSLLLAVRGKGLATSLDLCRPDPRAEAGSVDWGLVLANALPAVDVFAPSLGEICLMLGFGGAHEPGIELLRTLAGCLLSMGASVVALKLGDQGLYVRTTPDGRVLDRFCGLLGLDAAAWRGREVLAPCFRAGRVAGTTGSGDATIAGLLAALLRGEDPVSAATSASAVGACSVEEADATSGIPPWPDVAARLAAGWPRLPVGIDSGAAGTWRRDAHGTLFDPVG